jgi:predicted phage terminase large subunit-like protein
MSYDLPPGCLVVIPAPTAYAQPVDKHRQLDESIEESISTEEQEAVKFKRLRAVLRAAFEASVELDRQSLSHFVKSAWHVLEGATPLEWNWHHEAYCATLQGVLTEWLLKRKNKAYQMKVRKIVINLCPVSLKTRIMVFACAWMWLHAPNWKMMYMSGTPKVLEESSTACRDLVASQWYRKRFNIAWEIRDDANRLMKWSTTANGQRVSMGFEANITGVHVDCIMCDDPDDAHKVHSEAERRNVKGRWKAAGNRLNDLRVGQLIVVQQRVHPDDLSATCLQQGYKHACWPLEYNTKHRVEVPWFKDPRTKDGEVLHPARFTPEIIAEERLRLGTAGFEAQYNQRPETFEGALLRRLWFRFFRMGKQSDQVQAWVRPEGCSEIATKVVGYKRDGVTPDFDRVVMSVDASFGSLSDGASRVSISVYGMKGADRFVLHNSAKRRTLGETETTIAALYDAYPQVTKVLVEKKANGAAVIERMQGNISGMVPIEPDGGKEARAAAMQPAIEAGNVYVLEGAPWLMKGEEPDDAGWLDEMCSFPHGRKDDRVDDLSQFMNHFQTSRAKWLDIDWTK